MADYKVPLQKVNNCIDLLKDLGFKYDPTEFQWKRKKTGDITEELIKGSHDSTFLQMLSLALMENHKEAIQRYMLNNKD